MIVVMSNASETELQQVVEKLKAQGYDIHLSRGVSRTVIGAVGRAKPEEVSGIERMPGVEKVVPIMQPFKLVSRFLK